MSEKGAKSWGDATPLERLQAEVDDLRQGLQQLKENVSEALKYGGSLENASYLLDERWSE